MELPETDSKSTSIECSICGTTKILTYRLYGTKRKIYSMIPAGTSKRVTLICHRCLTEEPWKNYEKELIEKFDRWGKAEAKASRKGKYKHHEMILKITIHYNKK